ncbi:MAG: histidine phosphatase family protein [Pseudobacteriovorax sp.]|nr:histidine phosphatase family protein [Pseudobacteriovorax sp.]
MLIKAIVALSLTGTLLASSQESKIDTRDSQEKELTIDMLQEGGNVIYFRHAKTERDYADQVSADPNNCATQRVLSEEGWNDALRIGEAFRRLAIPVGDVLSSQYCRAWKTASLAFGKYAKNADFNFLPFEDYTPEQVELMRERVGPYLIQSPEAGLNTIIVAHDDPFEAVTGIYPEPQGIGFVLRPDGNGGFKILGSVAPSEWGQF